MKINLKIIIVLQILLVSCVNSAQQMQDREEEELRKKMMELKHGLNDMQKEINQEMELRGIGRLVVVIRRFRG